MKPKEALLGMTIPGLFILVFGGAFIFMTLDSCKALRTFTETEGRVVRYEEEYDSDLNDYVYRPVVQFKNQDGRAFTFTDSVGGGKSWEIGEEVDVLYNPKDPFDARLYTFSSLWLFPMICAIATLFAMGFLLLFFFSVDGKAG